MTPYIVGWAVLLFANMPIAFTLGVIAVIFIWMTDGPFVVVPQRLVAGLDSFPLLAVPAFVVAGEIMNAGGITRRLFRFTQACVGHITGGLGHVNVMANVIVSGISGSAIAEAISIGTLIIKAMKDEGYEGKFAAALTAAACTIGPLIPPSIPLVIYAVIASASVGKLLIAGFIPGFLVAIVLMVYVYFYAKRRGLKPAPRMTWRELGAATREAFWALLTPFIMIGGIIAGWFTATEAAATTAVYSLLVSMFIYREISWRDLPRILRVSAMTTATVGFIVATSTLVNYVLARERVPQELAEALLGFSDNPYVILTLINILMLILGCFMEGMAIMILTVPVCLPVVQALGIDPVHFGVIVVMNLMVGLLTPPFGMGLFVVAKIGNIPFEVLAREILPFIPLMILVLAICTYFPWLVMYFPNLLLD
jgi:tripartite ATP-independent transporter DctM subunit